MNVVPTISVSLNSIRESLVTFQCTLKPLLYQAITPAEIRINLDITYYVMGASESHTNPVILVSPTWKLD